MARRRKRRYRYYQPAARYPGNYEPLGLDLAPETKRGIAIIFFFLAAVISTFSLFNLAGNFGGMVARVLRLLFGTVAYITPALFLGVCLSLFLGARLRRSEEDKEAQPPSLLRTYFGAVLFTLAVTGLFHLFAINKYPATAFEIAQDGQGGGYLGIFTSFLLFNLMGLSASIVILAALILIAFLVAFNLSLHDVLRITLKIFSLPATHTRQPDETAAATSSEVKINTMESSGFTVNKVSPLPLPPVSSSEVEASLTQSSETFVPKTGKSAKTTLDMVPARFQRESWQLPPPDLLEETTTDVQSGNIEANVKIIKKTLEDFGIVVEMGEVNVGPTVTQYTFRPAVGVKLAQILSLQNDLALALAAPSIRVEAPIPGRSLVGVEIPNKTSALVRLKDLLAPEGFSKHPSNLAFALGRDVAGHPVIADLEKMPHLLIAGATGTGKSVCINTVLVSLLYRNSPEELRLIVIDPKRVELTLYNGIPHLLIPVVINHRQAVNALRWMVAEMDRRYHILSEAGKRNIGEYNQDSQRYLPYLVLVVDELADLMAVAQSEVEAAIVRLAQMARAVGLHLILATQRPSVNIITGLIKANITSRVAFAVASQVDSRTILDMAGAERLLGNGDMLYTTANLTKPKRIQAPFISEGEVRRVVEFLKDRSGEVDYQEEILKRPTRAAGVDEFEEETDEEMIEAAIEEIRRARKASASLLQRRLKLGYARAARILDILEEKGLIGPANGAKPREIYLDGEGWE